MPQKVAIGLLIAVVALGGMSCATKKNRPVSPAVSAPQSAAEYEAQLRSTINKYIDAAGQDKETERAPLVRRRPYYFKAYSIYPSDAAGAEITLQRRESRTRPYIADAKVEKLRYYTEMQKKRKAARQDDHFFRDTGYETLTYEYRNDRWWRVGSMFVPEKAEENVNGEWLPRREEVKVFLEPEEEDGYWVVRKFKQWFGRKNRD